MHPGDTNFIVYGRHQQKRLQNAQILQRVTNVFVEYIYVNR